MYNESTLKYLESIKRTCPCHPLLAAQSGEGCSTPATLSPGVCKPFQQLPAVIGTVKNPSAAGLVAAFA
jgi:hypothetical protein